MDRNLWINLRLSGQYDVDHLYEFYVSQKAYEKIDYNQFQQAIAHYVNNNGNLSYYLKHYDNLYEVNYLFDGQEKKIVI